jgi:hypothetical protein
MCASPRQLKYNRLVIAQHQLCDRGAVQYIIGSLGIRAEYERFEAAGGSPGLLTAGVTWTFF